MNQPIFGVPLLSLLVALVAATMGFMGHVLMKVQEIKDTDPSMTLVGYFARNGYRTAAKFVAVVFSAIALAESQITPMLLLGFAGIGYAADSVVNRMGK